MLKCKVTRKILNLLMSLLETRRELKLQCPSQVQLSHKLDGDPSPTNAAVKKAEDVVSSMLAKGLPSQIGLRVKLGTGITMFSGKVRDVDERYQVSEITRSALATAKQTATNTGSSVILSNRYVSTGASWISSALGKVVKEAEDVSMKTREKVKPPTVPVCSMDELKLKH
ncbi:hypothetical protein OPV22_017901 [Ensete ventricosum]|uniref:Senescence domain-containing protein n=1 Tax=Ensete ventricosum TaxID=4639 RepID=A0AAV8QU88_ENSVE|nr:hypothetical protein OPV22_017901 [Ensete ventricosum]